MLPGERVKVALEVESPGLVRALPVDILQKSPDRTNAPCPHFMACGGCHYQHASYAAQVALKVEILREQLRRVGHIQYEAEIAAVTGSPLDYRNRSQFHMDNGEIGYFAEGTHTVVPIKRCPISPLSMWNWLRLR